MIWLLFIAVYVVFFSVSAIVEKTLMTQEEADERAQSVGDGIIRGLVAVVVALAVGSFQPVPTSVLGIFIIAVLVDGLAAVSYYKALKTVQASIVSIAMATMFLWIAILSVIFLHETLTPMIVLGSAITFTGVAVALWKGQHLKLRSSLFYLFLAPFLWGLVVTLSYFILRSYNAPSLEAYENLAIAAVILIVQPVTLKKLKFFLKPKNGLLLAINGSLAALATIANFYAYQFGRNASVLAPLSSTRIIIILLLSAAFLHERDHLKRKLLGGGLALVGVAILLAR